LNWRTLEKPLANAISVTGIDVSASSRRAVCSRVVLASASGPAPSSASSSLRRCRSVTASLSASPVTPCSSTYPSVISLTALAARSARTFHSGEPGLASGRQRRHARNPAASAAPGCGKNRMLSLAGVRAGQIGRQ
jgi:hypothetical protein